MAKVCYVVGTRDYVCYVRHGKKKFVLQHPPFFVPPPHSWGSPQKKLTHPVSKFFFSPPPYIYVRAHLYVNLLDIKRLARFPIYLPHLCPSFSLYITMPKGSYGVHCFTTG